MKSTHLLMRAAAISGGIARRPQHIKYSNRLRSEQLEPRLALTVMTLPGDLQVDLATGNQTAPDIALGADTMLAVWSDSRADVTVFEGETAQDIYGMRISANGDILDTVPLALVTNKGAQDKPQVAWNGTNWLVVYHNSELGGTGLEAVRVSPDGEVLDAEPIKLYGLRPVNAGLGVASDGNNWVVVNAGGGIGNDIVGVRISADGTVVDSPARTLFESTSQTRFNYHLAHADGTFLLTFDTNIALGTLVTSTVRFDGNLDVLAIEDEFLSRPLEGLASNGNEFYAVWTQSDLKGSRISPAGVLLDGGGVSIAGTNPLTADVDWDGLNWRVQWTSGSTVRLAKVNVVGQVLEPGGVAVPGPELGPAAGTGQGGVQFVWSDFANNNDDVYTAFVSTTNNAGATMDLSVGAPQQLHPNMATNGNGYMMVYRSATSSSTRVLAQPLDAAGNAIGGGPIELAASGVNGLGSASIAWNGSVYMAVWSDVNGIVAQRLNPDGTLVDASPVQVMDSVFGAVRVAALNGDFLVTGRQFGFSTQVIVSVAARVRGSDGMVLDSTPLVVGGNYARFSPDVTTLGGRWMVVWHRNVSHDDSLALTQASFVDSDGTVSPTLEIHGFFSTAGGNSIYQIGLASNGTEAIVVQSQELTSGVETDLLAHIVHADGTVSPMINLTPWSGNQYNPRVSWDGTHFVVAYQDQKNRNAPFALSQLDARSDLYAMRISPSGTVVDPQGFVFSSELVGEADPAVASLDGTTMLAGSLVINDAATGNYRVIHDIFDASDNQWPVAVINATAASGDIPLNVDFSSAGSLDPDGSIASYEWNFKDGTTSSLPNPSHLFTTAGDRVVSLTVTDEQGAQTVQELLVRATNPNQVPVAVANADVSSGPAPLSVVFDADGSYDPDGFVGNTEWRFGDGTNSFNATAFKTYTIPGIYTVELFVHDLMGGVGTTTTDIYVLSGVPGDLDGNGILDGADADVLSHAIATGSSNLVFDFNGDLEVDAGDLEFWVVDLMGTLMGDANFDFVVDGNDFLAWNQHKFTAGTAWTDGNFNGDNAIDGLDFLIWNQNKFQSALAAPPVPAGTMVLRFDVESFDERLSNRAARDLAVADYAYESLACTTRLTDESPPPNHNSRLPLRIAVGTPIGGEAVLDSAERDEGSLHKLTHDIAARHDRALSFRL